MEIERTVDLPASPREVWDVLTDPATLAHWLGADRVELDLQPGGRARFELSHGERRDAVVQVVEPAARLRWRWWPTGDVFDASTVELVLERTEQGGTNLTATEVAFVDPPPEQHRPMGFVTAGLVR